MSIHEGHRKRVRDRFRASGLEGFADHEALELLLFYARTRGDVNPLAHALMDTFGSFHGVLEATADQLKAVSGIGEETATLLSLMLPLFRRYQASRASEQTVIRNRRDAEQYCQALLAGLRNERFCLLALNANCQLLGTRIIADGSLSEVPAYPRNIMEAAFNLNAHSVILCHNHPGGVPQPSRDDLFATRRIQDALEMVNINLLDHVIIAGESAYSMLQHGHLNEDQPDERSVHKVAARSSLSENMDWKGNTEPV